MKLKLYTFQEWKFKLNCGGKKRNILRNIFEEMDSDGDGIISKQSINLANIDGETL